MSENFKKLDIATNSFSNAVVLDQQIAILDDIVEQSYDIFSKYPVGGTLDACSCDSCLTQLEASLLLNQPLQSIGCGLVQSWNDAVKSKYPNLNEFKHFLPRILDVIASYQIPSHSVELGLNGFTHYSKEDWSGEEWNILTKYLDAFFEQTLLIFPLPKLVTIEELLVMVDKAGFDVSSYLKKWENSQSDEAVLHFCEWAQFGIQFGHEDKYKNEFASQNFIRTISDWLEKDGILLGFKDKIEALILSDKSIDQARMKSLNLTYEILSMLEPHK